MLFIYLFFFKVALLLSLEPGARKRAAVLTVHVIASQESVAREVFAILDGPVHLVKVSSPVSSKMYKEITLT